MALTVESYIHLLAKADMSFAIAFTSKRNTFLFFVFGTAKKNDLL